MTGAAPRLVGIVAAHAANDDQFVAHARRLAIAHSLRSCRLFGESLTVIQLLGGAMILGAVLVAEWGAIRSSTPARKQS